MRTANIPTRRLAQERRRNEAQTRQKAYDALSLDEKIKRNPHRTDLLAKKEKAAK